MKKSILCLMSVMLTLPLFAFSNFKDERHTYLWDVTLSMKGYGGAPDIYDEVVDALVRDIRSITDERTEIVVIPFQETAYCDVWRDPATDEGKSAMISKIKAYKNDKITHTNISAPLRYVIDNIFTADKIDILKLLTDGRDNVDPKRFKHILDIWCDLAKEKDAYGYYVLLTDAASDQTLHLRLEEVCRFDEVDVRKRPGGIAEIRQIGYCCQDVLINIRDDYNKPVRLSFNIHGGDENLPSGFKMHFCTSSNPYVEIDEEVAINADNTFEIHPKFKISQEKLKEQLPTEYAYSDIFLHYNPTEAMNREPYALIRVADKKCQIKLENRPVKTVNIYVKQ